MSEKGRRLGLLLACVGVLVAVAACGPNNLNNPPLTPIPAPAVTR